MTNERNKFDQFLKKCASNAPEAGLELENQVLALTSKHKKVKWEYLLPALCLAAALLLAVFPLKDDQSGDVDLADLGSYYFDTDPVQESSPIDDWNGLYNN